MAIVRWEYCILTRLSAGIDTKWRVNQVFQHAGIELPTEVTEPVFKKYNELFEKWHAAAIYPILPAVLNRLGADGWELIDDMDTGIPGSEGLVLKRPIVKAPAKVPARKSGGSKR